jgi:hypothetical protein
MLPPGTDTSTALSGETNQNGRKIAMSSIGTIDSSALSIQVRLAGTITRDALDQQGEISNSLIQAATQVDDLPNPDGTFSIRA